MFAGLFFERDPLGLQSLPPMLLYWAQVCGGWAAFGILLWLLFRLPRFSAADWARIPAWQSTLFIAGSVAAGICYLLLLILRLPEIPVSFSAKPVAIQITYPAWVVLLQVFFMTAGAVCALAVVFAPVIANLPQLRGRRIWALARLAFQEAMGKRILYVFSMLLLVFLFANWYIPYKPEDQVRIYVLIVFRAMALILLFSAVLLAAFSLPADMRQQTIHTVLTKPVERFEVILGRMLGFIGLMSVILLVITTFGLIYVLRNIDPEAQVESLKARVPLYGDLTFENTNSQKRGDSVGREWDYRSYISGPVPGKLNQTAVYSFATVPATLANRDLVRCEFTFDIYRTTKGDENQGVSCSFVFQTASYQKGSEETYQRRRQEEEAKAERPSDAAIVNKLSEELGYFEVSGKEVRDYHTQAVEVPGGLFRNALKPTTAGKPAVQVRILCNSQTQFVGMAKYDLYFRVDDDSNASANRFWFAVNFFKGALGLWFRLCLVIGLAVALSTYLSGVISLIVTLLFFLGGMFHDFIKAVGEGTNIGGGPMEAMFRLASRQNMAAPLENTTTVQVFQASDTVFRWMIRRVLDILPDVERFVLTPYVAEGFDISGGSLLSHLVLVIGYLIPCAILAFFLLRWREVAAPT